MTPVYELKEIRKQRGEAFVLRIAELAVQAGETLCLVGPTGAGKSTLLKLLSGLDKPTSGRLLWNGEATSNGEASLEKVRRVAMVHQRPLFLRGDVKHNVQYGLNVRGVRSAKKRCGAILDALGLSRLAKQDARTLSGGQLQLVAIARAIVVEPEILLLDEPTVHLDPASVVRVEDLIKTERERLGMTVVWATHHLFQARRLASRVALLLDGELIEAAETQTFFERPSDPRTADFIDGKMVY